jgi:hypothetical protein
MNIVTNSKIDKLKINHFFIEHWGSPEMVISSGTFQCSKLDSLVEKSGIGLHSIGFISLENFL